MDPNTTSKSCKDHIFPKHLLRNLAIVEAKDPSRLQALFAAL